MTPEVQALVTELGKKVDALIERRVAAAVLPIASALQGLGAIRGKLLTAAPALLRKASRPARAVKPKGGAGKRRVIHDEAYKKAVALKATSLEPTARLAYAKKIGIDKSRLYLWMKKYGGFAGRKAGPGAKEDKRRRHTPEFKAEVVDEAGKLAPGDRETYLASKGLNPSLYYKWSRALRKPAA